jgi:co-chaperonin GroES (HSP10)
MHIKPTQDYIVVEIIDPEYISQNGLILPEHRKKVFKGKIIEIAEGKRNSKGTLIPIDPDLKVGAIVMFSRFRGVAYEIGGKKMHWMKEEDFLFIVDDDPTPLPEIENIPFVKGITGESGKLADNCF